MSVTWDISNINKKEQETVRSDLTFYRKQSMIFNDNKERPTEAITCVKWLDKNTVLIPFDYAKESLGITNDFDKPKRKFKQLLHPRDEKQKRERKEIIKNLKEHKNIAVNVRTGAGKTALAAFAMCKFQTFNVVLVPTKNDCTQWAQAIKKYSTAKVQIVELKGTVIAPDTDVVICLYSRWEKIPEDVRCNVGLLVIDEYDVFCNAGGFESIINIQPLMIMGCTATPKCEGTGLDGVLTCFLGTRSVTREFDVKFTVTKIQTNLKGERVKSKHTRGCEWNTLKHSLIYNPIRILMIACLVEQRLEEGRKILILTTEVQYAQVIHDVLIDRGIKCDIMYGNKKMYKDSDVLVGITKKVGRGFDEENGCEDWGGVRINDIIIVDHVKNRSNIIQYIGRGFRALDPHVDHFTDNDPTVKKQTEVACKLYAKLGAPIEEMEYNPKDFEAEAKSNKIIKRMLNKRNGIEEVSINRKKIIEDSLTEDIKSVEVTSETSFTKTPIKRKKIIEESSIEDIKSVEVTSETSFTKTPIKRTKIIEKSSCSHE